MGRWIETLMVLMAALLQSCDCNKNIQGNLLAEYKWISVIQSQIPIVSDDCVRAFHDCGNFNYTFEELLFDYGDRREQMCEERLWQYGCLTKRRGECSKSENDLIEKLICYRYNISDNQVPPISKSCATNYWQCLGPERNILEGIPVNQIKKLCEKDVFDKCFGFADYDDVRDEISKVLNYLCGTTSTSPETIDTFVEYPILRCYGQHFNMIIALANTRIASPEHYLCIHEEECVTPIKEFPDFGCSLTEIRVLDQFLCSDVSFTPDIFGLFMISDECKNFFQECSIYTTSDLTNDLFLRRGLCQTRNTSFMNCLEQSKCADMKEEIGSHYQQTFGKFLCFNKDDPILMISNACTRNFINCYKLPSKEGFSYLEMNDKIHLKKEFCQIQEENKQCMETFRLGYDRGCSQDELKIIGDFLCGSNVNNPENFPRELLQYKWGSIVHGQIPSIPENCTRDFQDCYNSSYTFEQLLFNYNDIRKDMCKSTHDLSLCLGYPRVHCSVMDIYNIENFLCYEYNVSDNNVPPISTTCAMKYWNCSQVQLNFLERIPVDQKPQLCEIDCFRNKLFSPSDMALAVDIQDHLCNRSTHSNISISNSTQLLLDFQMCYGRHFSLFKVLADMKPESTQPYVCGGQEGCITSSSGFRGLNCSQAEAEVLLDQFMCSDSDVGFVLDPSHPLFLLTDECKEAFRKCTNDDIFDLRNNSEVKKDLCRNTNTSLTECLDNSPCNDPAERIDNYKYIRDFLCVSEDPFRQVTDACVKHFHDCREKIIAQNGSSLSLKISIGWKAEYCRIKEETKTCMGKDNYCTEEERTIIGNYLCTSSSCNIRAVTSWMVGVWVWVAAVATCMD